MHCRYIKVSFVMQSGFKWADPLNTEAPGRILSGASNDAWARLWSRLPPGKLVTLPLKYGAQPKKAVLHTLNSTWTFCVSLCVILSHTPFKTSTTSVHLDREGQRMTVTCLVGLEVHVLTVMNLHIDSTTCQMLVQIQTTAPCWVRW